jgi:hypothetical protein
MAWYDSLLGGGSKSPIQAVFDGIDSLVTSDEERAAADLLKMKVMQEPGKLQVELNKIEASHRSVFVAGWRPFIGWICGFGLGYVWVVRPLIMDIVTMVGSEAPTWAPMNTDNMIDLVIALLGLGGLRTYEKLNGRAK